MAEEARLANLDQRQAQLDQKLTEALSYFPRATTQLFQQLDQKLQEVLSNVTQDVEKLDEKLTEADSNFALDLDKLTGELEALQRLQAADRDKLSTGLQALEHRQGADRDQIAAAHSALGPLQKQYGKLFDTPAKMMELAKTAHQNWDVMAKQIVSSRFAQTSISSPSALWKTCISRTIRTSAKYSTLSITRW